jgi:hypothetical protein
MGLRALGHGWSLLLRSSRRQGTVAQRAGCCAASRRVDENSNPETPRSHMPGSVVAAGLHQVSVDAGDGQRDCGLISRALSRRICVLSCRPKAPFRRMASCDGSLRSWNGIARRAIGHRESTVFAATSARILGSCWSDWHECSGLREAENRIRYAAGVRDHGDLVAPGHCRHIDRWCHVDDRTSARRGAAQQRADGHQP